MTIRTRRESVSFAAPFALPGLDGLQPAGTYVVEMDEEQIEPLSFIAWRRLSTTIVVPSGPASYQMIRVDPAVLEAAQAGSHVDGTPG
jgi:hypothetical protein